MKKKKLLFVLVILAGLLVKNVYAIDHGSLSVKNAPLYMQRDGIPVGSITPTENQPNPPGNPVPGQTVDFKLVTIGNKSWAWTEIQGANIGDASYSSQLRWWNFPAQSGDNLTGKVENNLTFRVDGTQQTYGTTANKPAGNPLIVTIFQDADGFKETDDFPYDYTAKNSIINGDNTPPVITTINKIVTDNSVTFEIAATEENDFFYYITDGENYEEVSFLNTFTVSDLLAGCNYTYTLIAIDFNGNESEPKLVSFKTTGVFDITKNLALNKPSYASSGNAKLGNDGIDKGAGETRWESDPDDTEWWYVDLGVTCVVNKIQISWEGAYSKKYKIQTALTLPENDEGWQDALIIEDGEGGVEILELISPARYVKFQGIKRGTGYGNSFYEFSVYATGPFDPNASDDLSSVSIGHDYSAFYVDDSFQFIAYPLNGKNQPIEVDELIWSVTAENGSPTETAEITEEGMFIATQPGIYIIICTAVDDVTVDNSITITVLAAREPDTINVEFNPNYNLWGLGEVADFIIKVADQYGNPMTDAIIEYLATEGTVIKNGNGYSGTFSSLVAGEIIITATVTKGNSQREKEIPLTVIPHGALVKTDWTASATEGEAGNAIDEDFGSLWIIPEFTADTQTEDYIIIDMQRACFLDMIDLRWEAANPRKYDVSGSLTGNEEDWTRIGGQENLPTQQNIYYRGLVDPSLQIRYIRIDNMTSATNYGIKLFEITPFGAPVPVTTTWQGVSDDWTSASNWDIRVPETVDNVIIPKKTIYPVVPSNTTINNIKFEAGAEIDRQDLLTFNKASVELDLTPNRWHMLAMPVAATAGDFYFGGSPSSWIRTFITTAGSANNQAGWKYVTSLDESFGIGDGFAFRVAGSENQKITLEGDALAGVSVSEDLDFGADLGSYFALAGNPFMTTINFNALYTANNNAIAPSYLIWTGATGFSGYNKSGTFGTITIGSGLSQDIAPLQSFILEKANETSINLNFNLADIQATGSVELKSDENPGNKLDIIASNPTASVLTFIANREDGQSSRKLFSERNNVPDIYTLNGDIALGANIIHTNDILVPVGLATTYTGNMSLTFKGMDSYDAQISFMDVVANQEVDITGLNTYEYTFDYAAEENRFFVRIQSSPTGLNNLTANEITVYSKDKTIFAISGSSDLIRKIRVYNTQGVLVYADENVNAPSYTINCNVNIPEVCVVKLITDRGAKNMKVLVK
jgi:hypothetical protein